MSFGRATPEQVLTAVQIELALIVKRLIACRNRISRDTGTYPDDPGAALQRAEFLLHDILGGLITPAAAKTETAHAPVSPNGRVSGDGCAGANRALSKTPTESLHLLAKMVRIATQQLLSGFAA